MQTHTLENFKLKKNSHSAGRMVQKDGYEGTADIALLKSIFLKRGTKGNDQKMPIRK